jgi:Cdc6-like AAA superfamily ATPase
VTDAACIKFSRSFYTAMFSEGKTPCESFNLAQQALSITQGLGGQSALFILKTKSTLEKEHHCAAITVFKGKPKRIGAVENKIRLNKNIPPPVESFIGRNQDVCQVLRELQKTRLITLTGEPGIGKTAVAKTIANYLKLREGEFIKNGVMFLNVINCASTTMLKHKFIKAFREGIGKSLIKMAEKKDTEAMFNEVLHTLSNIEILVVIDDAEDLLRTSK